MQNLIIKRVRDKIISYSNKDSYSYVIEGKPLILIDAGFKIPNLKPDLVIITHAHYDHIKEMCYYKKLGAKILIGAKERPFLRNLERINKPVKIEGLTFRDWKFCDVNDVLHEGDVIKNENVHFIVMGVPGHTPGGIALWEPNLKILFSGDTWYGNLVVGSIASGGNLSDLFKSYKRLKTLKPLAIFPGHNLSQKILTNNWLSVLATPIFSKLGLINLIYKLRDRK